MIGRCRYQSDKFFLTLWKRFHYFSKSRVSESSTILTKVVFEEKGQKNAKARVNFTIDRGVCWKRFRDLVHFRVKYDVLREIRHIYCGCIHHGWEQSWPLLAAGHTNFRRPRILFRGKHGDKMEISSSCKKQQAGISQHEKRCPSHRKIDQSCFSGIAGSSSAGVCQHF